MKAAARTMARRYQAALREHLSRGPHSDPAEARGLGNKARTAGLQVLDLAKIHEQTLVTELLPSCPVHLRTDLIKQAGAFFAVAIIPIDKSQHPARNLSKHLQEFVETLSERTVELAASNLELSREIAQRKVVEEALKTRERHYSELLAKSDQLHEQLRRLSRQILSAQEDERRKISRELHDVIAQTLTGINVRLATLRTQSTANTKGLQQKIASTQKLVEHSVDIVHRFARELRPAVLDDLGLIPALHSFMRAFNARTGIHTSLKAFSELDLLDPARRTVLFRVAQEALVNVDRHAQATRLEVHIEKLTDSICMRIHDNGKSFNSHRVLQARGGKRLGLLGMRERLEMIGGRLSISSAVGTGTTIEAHIPLTPPKAKPTRPHTPPASPPTTPPNS